MSDPAPFPPGALWARPWLRLELIIRTLLTTRWGIEWPRLKRERDS